jgi:hypothetical protein
LLGAGVHLFALFALPSWTFDGQLLLCYSMSGLHLPERRHPQCKQVNTGTNPRTDPAAPFSTGRRYSLIP